MSDLHQMQAAAESLREMVENAHAHACQLHTLTQRTGAPKCEADASTLAETMWRLNRTMEAARMIVIRCAGALHCLRDSLDESEFAGDGDRHSDLWGHDSLLRRNQ